jgi:hypothetical protein
MIISLGILQAALLFDEFACLPTWKRVGFGLACVVVAVSAVMLSVAQEQRKAANDLHESMRDPTESVQGEAKAPTSSPSRAARSVKLKAAPSSTPSCDEAVIVVETD